MKRNATILLAALGLLTWPTMGYLIDAPELPRSPLWFIGFPLPWMSESEVGAGNPTDYHLVPLAIDLVFYLWICTLAWRKLERALLGRRGIQVAALGYVWIFGTVSVLVSILPWAIGEGRIDAWYKQGFEGWKIVRMYVYPFM